VNWNQKNDGWAELKGQAKGQIQEPVNEVAEFTAIKQIRRERESLKSIMTIKTRAERQLLELQDLLQIMENFQSADVSATHKV
jgi:hypothetical protein